MEKNLKQKARRETAAIAISIYIQGELGVESGKATPTIRRLAEKIMDGVDRAVVDAKQKARRVGAL